MNQESPYIAAEKDAVIKWLRERRENCKRIAQGKLGDDRRGWLVDAEWFDRTIALLEESRT
jgi:hypothetical protein